MPPHRAKLIWTKCKSQDPFIPLTPLIDQGHNMREPLQSRKDAETAHLDPSREARPEPTLAANAPTAAQRKLTEKMNSSSHALQQRVLSDAIRNSPRTVLQRHKMDGLVGHGHDGHLPHEVWHAIRRAPGQPASTRRAPAGAVGGAAVQRKPLVLPHPQPGNNDIWEVDTRSDGKEYLKNWIDSASQSNLPALNSLIQQLGPIQVDEFERWLLLYARLAYRRARQLIQVNDATYIPGDVEFSTRDDVPPATTLIMRAINTGDMYQVRGSMVLHPEFKLLIWNVTPQARAQANMAAAVIGAPDRVFYTDCPVPPPGYAKSETWTTSDIEANVSGDLLFTVTPTIDKPKGEEPKGDKTKKDKPKNEDLRNANFAKLAGDDRALAELLNLLPGGAEAYQAQKEDDRLPWLQKTLGKIKNQEPALYTRAQDVYRRFCIADLANKYAPYSQAQAHAFEHDLQARGHFDRAPGPYVIVNFRDTGHSARPGANAPALDTGLTGVQQIIDAIQKELGTVQVVAMGEKPDSLRDQPNLLKYWEWPSVQQSRLDQTLLLKYLKDNYPIVGAVGMRSGVMDQLALLGIPIVSIDISPHSGLADGELPDLATSKGWDRGLKLEDSYRQNYGHAFIKHARKDEKKRKMANWEGAFHPEDIAAIASAVDFYLGDKAKSDNYRHQSHPLQPAQVREGLDHLIKVVRRPEGITAYALIEHLRPYVKQLKTLVTSSRAQQSESLGGLLSAFDEVIETMVNRKEAGQARGIKWMRDNQKQALLTDDRHGRWYREQSAWAATAFGMEPEQAAIAVQQYRALNEHYLAPPETERLLLLHSLVEAIERVQAVMAYLGMNPRTSSTSH